MSTSTDAILLYGVLLSEDTVIAENEEDEESADDLVTMLVNGKTIDGCVIVAHCSGECPMYFVAIDGTVTTANRGYPKVVHTSRPSTEWDKRLKAFCKKHSLSHSKPDWYIASMWD
jgi:hypothetical protein